MLLSLSVTTSPDKEVDELVIGCIRSPCNKVASELIIE